MSCRLHGMSTCAYQNAKECRHCGNLFAPLGLDASMPLSSLSPNLPPFMGDAMTVNKGRIIVLSSTKNIAIAYDLPDA